jgi:hypothetical protein
MTDDSQPGVLDKVAVFRGFAEEATKNSHATIKQVWTILFTGGTFALLHSFDRLVISFEDIFDGSYDSNESYMWCERFRFDLSEIACWRERFDLELYTLMVSLLLFVVYLLTFYRFYVGNIRVFDMKYDEAFKFIDSRYKAENWDNRKPDNSKKNKDYQKLLQYSTRLSGRETFQLMINTLVIVYLTVLPLSPFKFLLVYFILLILDMLWIWKSADRYQHFFQKRFFEEFEDRPPKNLIEEVFPKYATDRWHANNLLFAFVLLVVLIIYVRVFFESPVSLMQEREEVILLALGAAVALMNCVVDLRCTWGFYNPKFSLAYQSVAQLQPQQGTEQDTEQDIEQYTKQDTECTYCWLLRIIMRLCALPKTTNGVLKSSNQNVGDPPAADGGGP